MKSIDNKEYEKMTEEKAKEVLKNVNKTEQDIVPAAKH